MNPTRIQLIGDNKGYLDVDGKAAFPLNFGISEIRDISKRKGIFSKSITLADTNNNHKMLNYLFDVNIQFNTFNINKLQYCNVIQDGIIILDNMLLQLVSIEKIQNSSTQEEEIKYIVLIKDSLGDLFTTIDNLNLQSLSGFSAMNHIYTADNVVASFGHTIEDGYKYVMPFGDNANDTSFLLDEFKPAIYAKRYFDGIFANAGYSYKWESMDDDDIRFSKLLIPYIGDAPIPDDTDTGDKFVNVERTYGSQEISSILTLQNNFFPATYISPQPQKIQNLDLLSGGTPSLYDELNDIFKTDLINPYDKFVKYEIESLDWEVYLDNTFYSHNVKLWANDLSGNGNTGLAEGYGLTLVPSLSIATAVDNTEIATASLNWSKKIYANEEFPPGNTVFFSGTSYNIDLLSNVSIPSNDGSILRFNFLIDDEEENIKYTLVNALNGINVTQARFKFRIKNLKVKISTIYKEKFTYNMTIPMDKFIPKEFKQSDFLKSIFNMFNLYALPDEDNPKQINLTTRDKFYDSGKIEDWTYKLVKDKTQEIKFLPELTNKKILLTYKKDDDDLLSKAYLTGVGKVYGQLEYTFNNEYVKGKQTKELAFAPTLINNTRFGAILPTLPGLNSKGKPRILYDGGEYPTTSSYIIFNYESPFINGSNSITGNTYPHITHWDKPINPTFDLNFGVCDYYLRTDNFGQLTNNNLFNLHWRRTFNQINNGKLLTANFQLSSFDIRKMKMNDTIKIGNSYWNINSIKDYDVNGTGPTKVELISIDDRQPIKFIQSEGKALLPTDIKLNDIRKLNGQITKDKNTITTPNDVMVQGSFNVIGQDVINANIVGHGNMITKDNFIVGNGNISESTGVIFGDNNINNSDKSFVIGSNNIIPSNVGNSVVIGNNISAVSGNTFYVNNIQVTSGGTINGVQVEQALNNVIYRLINPNETYVYGNTGSTETEYRTFVIPANTLKDLDRISIDELSFFGDLPGGSIYINIRLSTDGLFNDSLPLVAEFQLGAEFQVFERRSITFREGYMISIGNFANSDIFSASGYSPNRVPYDVTQDYYFHISYIGLASQGLSLNTLMVVKK